MNNTSAAEASTQAMSPGSMVFHPFLFEWINDLRRLLVQCFERVSSVGQGHEATQNAAIAGV
jgi:hypothetical protein